MVEGFTLNTFLSWLIAGGVTIVIRMIVARIPAWKRSLTESERGVISAFAAAVSVAALYYVSVDLGYVPRPETSQAWGEQLFIHVGTALGLPALMTTTIEVRAARYNRKHPRVVAMGYDRNRLFRYLW